MSKRKNEDMPIGKLTRIEDFLPPPEELVIPEDEKVQVTIKLSKATVKFFKQQAKRHRIKYQKMIRELLDTYTIAYQSSK